MFFVFFLYALQSFSARGAASPEGQKLEEALLKEKCEEEKAGCVSYNYAAHGVIALLMCFFKLEPLLC